MLFAILFLVILAIICGTGYFFVKKWKKEKLLERRRLAAIANTPLGPAGAKIPAPGTTGGAPADPDLEELEEPPPTIMPAAQADPLRLSLAAQLEKTYKAWQQTHMTEAQYKDNLVAYNKAFSGIKYLQGKSLALNLVIADPVQDRLEGLKQMHAAVAAAHKTTVNLLPQLMPLAGKAWKEWKALGRALKKVRRYLDAELPADLRAVRAAAEELMSYLDLKMSNLYYECKKYSKAPPPQTDHVRFCMQMADGTPFTVGTTHARAQSLKAAMSGLATAWQAVTQKHRTLVDARFWQTRAPIDVRVIYVSSSDTEATMRATLSSGIQPRRAVIQSEMDVYYASVELLKAVEGVNAARADLHEQFKKHVPDASVHVRSATSEQQIASASTSVLRMLLLLADHLLYGPRPDSVDEAISAGCHFRDDPTRKQAPAAALPESTVLALNKELDDFTDKLLESLLYMNKLASCRHRFDCKLKDYERQAGVVRGARLVKDKAPDAREVAAKMAGLLPEYVKQYEEQRAAVEAYEEVQRTMTKLSGMIGDLDKVLKPITAKAGPQTANPTLAARLQVMTLGMSWLRQAALQVTPTQPSIWYNRVIAIYNETRRSQERSAVPTVGLSVKMTGSEADHVAALTRAVTAAVDLHHGIAEHKDAFMQLRKEASEKDFTSDEPAKPTEVLVAAFQQHAIDRVVSMFVNAQKRKATETKLQQLLQKAQSANQAMGQSPADTRKPLSKMAKHVGEWLAQTLVRCQGEITLMLNFAPALTVPVSKLADASPDLLAMLAAPENVEKNKKDEKSEQPEVEAAKPGDSDVTVVPVVDPLLQVKAALRTLSFALAQSRVYKDKHTAAEKQARPVEPYQPPLGDWKVTGTCDDHLSKMLEYVKSLQSRAGVIQKLDKAEADALAAWTARHTQVKSAAETLLSAVDEVRSSVSGRAALLVAAADRLVQIYNR